MTAVSEQMSIGDFARRAGLAVSAVRFYGDRGLLPPAAVDPATGYRSYRGHQVDRALLIRDLRRLDMPLAEVAAYLGAPPAARRELLEAHLDRLERRLAEAREVAHVLHRGLRTATTGSEPPMTTTTTIASRDLAAALDQVLPAASRDPEQPVLSCVLVEGRDGSLRLAATDRYRLAVRDIAFVGGTGTPFRALVPAATLRRWHGQLPGGGAVAIGVVDDHLALCGGGIDLRVAQVPAAFPAYEDVLAREHDAHAVVVGRDRLHAALARFTGGEGAVLLHAGSDRLTLVRREDEVAIAARHRSPDVHVALDPNFAADAVAAAVGPEVVIEIGDALHPVVFRSADDGTFTTLLMPVRLA